MDLSTIKMHLDNFVDTWQGWGKIFDGLTSSAYGENRLTGAIKAITSIFSASSTPTKS
ncbi:hypothetical protein [Corynebacterium sp. UBA2622]|uniref:hypothetical protein n=1 Tax=Corynebacterium sp. UBA2622 TaxID=1946393 RepID=UPI0025C40F2C|nr:hypothetical protein [Corynebacterium sp. UBA2622]